MRYVIILAVLFILISGCSKIIQEKTPPYDKDSVIETQLIQPLVPPSPPLSVKTPFEIKLSLLDKPLLDKPVTLTAAIKSLGGSLDLIARIELPEGFEFINGDLSWEGDLKMNEERKIQAEIKSKSVGYHQIQGFISTSQSGGGGNANILYVEVTPDDAIIGSKPENNWHEPAMLQAAPTSENNDKIQSELIISQNPELNKEFIVIYKVKSLINIPGGRVDLIFPPRAFGIEDIQFPEGPEWMNYKTDGQIGWQGAINKDQTIELKATFKVINTGWGYLFGSLNVQPRDEIKKLIVDTKSAMLYVDKYEGYFTIE